LPTVHGRANLSGCKVRMMSAELESLELDIRTQAASFVKWAGGKSQLL